MKKQFFLGLGALALLASCSNESDSPVANIKDGYLKVNATINEVKTRVSGTDFDQDDAIGVNVTGGQQNVSYTFNGSAFAATTDKIKVSEGEMKVTAYSPYTSQVTDNKINFTLVDESQSNAPVAVEDVDFLFAPEVTVAEETAKFSFSHKMSQLALTIKAEDEDLEPSSLTLTLNKVAVKGTFDTTTGKVKAETANGQMYVSSVDLEEEVAFILPSYSPNNADAIEVVVNVDGTNYRGNVTPALSAGNKYTYTLTIPKSESGEVTPTPGEEKELSVSSEQIGDWKPVVGGDTGLKEDYVLSVGDYLLLNGETKAPTDKNFSTFRNQIVGVVYYVGNPQASELYSGEIDAENDILKIDAPSATRGLAIALDNANDGNPERFLPGKNNYATWVTNNKDSDYVKNLYTEKEVNSGTAPVKMLGYNFTVLLQRAENPESTNAFSESNIVSFLKTYNDNNEVENASDWYLPSYAEFEQILKVYDKVNASLYKLSKSLTQYNQYYLYTPSSDGKPSYMPSTQNFYWTSNTRNGSNIWVHELNTEISKPQTDGQDPQDEYGFDMWQANNSSGYKGYFRFAIAF